MTADDTVAAAGQAAGLGIVYDHPSAERVMIWPGCTVDHAWRPTLMTSVHGANRTSSLGTSKCESDPKRTFGRLLAPVCLLSQYWLKPDHHADRQMTAPINATTLAHNYRPDIDGLRAVAVLSVVIFHAFPDEAWLPGGFVGVDVFFVISGYLISKIVFSESEQHRFSLASFYGRRIRRIFPALAVCLAAVLA